MADLHVHSKYSEAPPDWFLDLFSIAESYTEPSLLYERAKRAGMSFVALTDHNNIEGALILKEQHPEDVIVGVETTALFPEDGCKVHVLLWGITEREFAEVQRLRKDLYALRDYIRERDLAHSVAHAVYPVQCSRLTVEHLEKLIVLFNVFEVINGGRNRADNTSWARLLANLTPAVLHDLSRKHSLEPFDNEPWVKGFTGGSDDHVGLFMGKTFTVADAAGPDEFLTAIRSKKSRADGRYNDYQSLAFTVFKATWDSACSKQTGASRSLLGDLTASLFSGKKMSISQRFKLRRLKSLARRTDDPIYASVYDVAQIMVKGRPASVEERVSAISERVALLSDELLRRLLLSFERNMAKTDLLAVINSLSAAIPGIFLSLPFLVTLKHLTSTRHLVTRLVETLDCHPDVQEEERILWFTDTLNDLNGVSVTLKEIGWLAHRRGSQLKIVSSLLPLEVDATLPPNVLNIPFIYQFRLPYYESYVIKMPSILRSLEQLCACNPDRIYVSTPGPVGMLGVLMAMLLSVPCVGFYHTDFTLQAREINRDESVASILESYTRWFYSLMDETRVPSAEYVELLANRGFDRRKLSVFTRGIEPELFRPREEGKNYLQQHFSVPDGITLLFAGRISRDKNLDLLLDSYEHIAREKEGINLVIAGDGPYLPQLMLRSQGNPRIVFTGRLDQTILPYVYSGADLFVFPSATDTFGKVVLEVQACGLPAVVSDAGGPQEIIREGRTGFIARAGDIEDWCEKIEQALHMRSQAPALYRKMREAARAHVLETYRWDAALDALLEREGAGQARVDKKIA